MKYPISLKIALRQVVSRSHSTFVRTVSILSVAGIAIGVSALLILNSFMDGFVDSILNNLESMNAPLEVRAMGGTPITDNDLVQLSMLADSLPGISAVSPQMEKTAIIAGSNGEVAGFHMRGVDISVESEILSDGILDGFTGCENSILIGKTLAARLGVSVGDFVRLASTDETSFSAAGRLLVDTIITIQVADVVDFGLDEFNSGLVITDIGTAAALFGSEISASKCSAGLRDGYDVIETADAFSAQLEEGYFSGRFDDYLVCEPFIRRHANLFAALGLEKLGMTIVLALITVVALLNLLSALNMIALEHRKDTGILRAMGASPGLIIRTGLIQGGLIGFAGAATGTFTSVGGTLIINRYFPINLESSVYWIETMQGKLDPMFILTVSGATVAACLIAAFIPAVAALSLSPSKAVRYE